MKVSRILEMCLNYKVLLGIIALIALAYFFAPQFAKYTWILLTLLCPLSMMVMMRNMGHGKSVSKSKENIKDNEKSR